MEFDFAIAAAALSVVGFLTSAFLSRKSLKATVDSIQALHKHDPETFVINVGAEKYVVPLTDPGKAAAETDRANTAIKEARAKIINAA